MFGSSLVQYVKWAARGFADPAAYVCFLAGLCCCRQKHDGAARPFRAASGAGLLLALALFVRPNIAPAAGVLLAGAGARRGSGSCQIGRVAGLCIGFLPVLGMALHNWVYGGVFVLFTSTAAHPTTLVMPPSAYLAASWS